MNNSLLLGASALVLTHLLSPQVTKAGMLTQKQATLILKLCENPQDPIPEEILNIGMGAYTFSGLKSVSCAGNPKNTLTCSTSNEIFSITHGKLNCGNIIGKDGNNETRDSSKVPGSVEETLALCEVSSEKRESVFKKISGGSSFSSGAGSCAITPKEINCTDPDGRKITFTKDGEEHGCK